MPTAQAQVGPDPYVIVAVLEETPDAEVSQTVCETIACNSLRGDMVKPNVGGDPHFAMAALEKPADEVAGNGLRGIPGIVR
jgi:hypothetical protein